MRGARKSLRGANHRAALCADRLARNDARAFYLLPGSLITRLATSLFQMNSTISAPIVAVMKPAPWFWP
jgi:hypothetical protein